MRLIPGRRQERRPQNKEGEDADCHKREARRMADGMQQVQAATETYYEAEARYRSERNGCTRQTANSENRCSKSRDGHEDQCCPAESFQEVNQGLWRHQCAS